ncbi:MAG: hypothetical protein CMJ18_16650 [Phycisphaeraceae bacterium]|nr:hypothetical protein [Phycisphaeraceae bacterium]
MEGRSPRFEAGLAFHVAGELEQVIQAWQLVYRAHLESGLVRPSPHRIHTTPLAATRNAAVLYGAIGPLTVSTLTAVNDDVEAGLPLDETFGDALDMLRHDGRRLLEIGLCADRRRVIIRSAAALFELIRHVFYFARHLDRTDVVLAVDAQISSHYERMFGFVPVGSEVPRSGIQSMSVTLMRCDLKSGLETEPLHPYLAYCQERPVPDEAFEQRFDFASERIAGSPIDAYLQERERTVILGQAG